MTGNSIILSVLGAAFVVATAYAWGRLHQRYQHALERDEAWWDGYDSGSGSMFKLASRIVGRRRPGESTTDIMMAVQEKPGAPSTVTAITAAPSYGRHSFELRHEQTRRLSAPGERAL